MRGAADPGHDDSPDGMHKHVACTPYRQLCTGECREGKGTLPADHATHYMLTFPCQLSAELDWVCRLVVLPHGTDVSHAAPVGNVDTPLH